MMSEHEKLHQEAEAGHERLDLQEASEEKLKQLEKTAEKSKDVEHDHNLDKIHESIHKEAVSAKEVTVGEHRQDSGQSFRGVQKELKADAYRRSIKKIRSSLSPSERVLSKVVHNSVVEPVSEFSAKTIARPSGILGGGIAALAGSGVVLFMAKRYGFEYNFTAFLVFIASGFAAGLFAELLIRLFRRKRS
jgi:hypothetical protein